MYEIDHVYNIHMWCVSGVSVGVSVVCQWCQWCVSDVHVHVPLQLERLLLPPLSLTSLSFSSSSSYFSCPTEPLMMSLKSTHNRQRQCTGTRVEYQMEGIVHVHLHVRSACTCTTARRVEVYCIYPS